MNIEEGKTKYFYDNREEENVCKAHVLHILPTRSEKDLREITDGDINDTWYVKMAHQMMQQRRKSSIELREGDRFQQAWKGCKEPMWFKVLSIDRPNNSLRVECHSHNGDMHEEEWDDLDVTESAFGVGDYKMIEDN